MGGMGVLWGGPSVDATLFCLCCPPLPTAAAMAYRHTGNTLSVREPDARPTPLAALGNFELRRRCRRISIDAADASRPKRQK